MHQVMCELPYKYLISFSKQHHLYEIDAIVHTPIFQVKILKFKEVKQLLKRTEMMNRLAGI